MAQLKTGSTVGNNAILTSDDVAGILSDALAAAKDTLYPVGSIYTNANVSTNPATLLGFGTWTAFGEGKVLVGLDSEDTSFDALEETGGSKNAIVVSHTHTFSANTSTTGAHQHGSGWGEDSLAPHGVTDLTSRDNRGSGDTDANNYEFLTDEQGSHEHSVSGTTASAGSTGTNKNLQPYIVVKMWKRTA